MPISDITNKRYEGKPRFRVYYIPYARKQSKTPQIVMTEFFSLTSAMDFIDQFPRLHWKLVKTERRKKNDTEWKEFSIEEFM